MQTSEPSAALVHSLWEVSQFSELSRSESTSLHPQLTETNDVQWAQEATADAQSPLHLELTLREEGGRGKNKIQLPCASAVENAVLEKWAMKLTL